jgi:succinoglycan biosynthesis protein ExoM
MRVPVDVCIATFRRPHLLARLLTSLAAQRLEGIAMRIIVVDNDRDGSARAVAAGVYPLAGAGVAPEIVYDIEPRQSIALARNRAMQHVRAACFAFVDDDQTVSQYWLASLLHCMCRFQCDVVFGPVVSELPADAPAWALTCFAKPRHGTGDVMQYGGSGNVLIRTRAVAGMRFDPAFGLTGGEDTDFFYRLHLAGVRMVWCEEASATEPVAPARLTLASLRRRGFRDGQNYARIFVKPAPVLRKAGWLLGKLAQLGGGLLLAPLVLCVSYRRYVALTVRLAAATGQLTTLFSDGYLEEYRASGNG